MSQSARQAYKQQVCSLRCNEPKTGSCSGQGQAEEAERANRVRLPWLQDGQVRTPAANNEGKRPQCKATNPKGPQQSNMLYHTTARTMQQPMHARTKGGKRGRQETRGRRGRGCAAQMHAQSRAKCLPQHACSKAQTRNQNQSQTSAAHAIAKACAQNAPCSRGCMPAPNMQGHANRRDSCRAKPSAQAKRVHACCQHACPKPGPAEPTKTTKQVHYANQSKWGEGRTSPPSC